MFKAWFGDKEVDYKGANTYHFVNTYEYEYKDIYSMLRAVSKCFIDDIALWGKPEGIYVNGNRFSIYWDEMATCIVTKNVLKNTDRETYEWVNNFIKENMEEWTGLKVEDND